MIILTSPILLLLLIVHTRCFVPNCIANNQFKFYQFPVEGCSKFSIEGCEYNQKGHFKTLSGSVSIVKIHETELLPSCAFFNVSGLKHIYGVNSKIKVLANGAFINLPDLATINLALNQIREVRRGVFVEVAATILNLSWNNIIYIDQHAFNGMANLKTLDLSKNCLQFLPISDLPRSIASLNLAHNLLNRIALNSAHFTQLTNINISSNVLTNLAVAYHYTLENLDLTNNILKNFDYLDIFHVKKLRIGDNLFTDKLANLENLNAEEVEIYPNPWDCQQLHDLWAVFTNLNYRITPPGDPKSETIQICTNSVNNKLRGKPTTRSSKCRDDSDCSGDTVCKTTECQDPCRSKLCHSSNICLVKNHTLNCSCPSGQLSNPLDITRSCHKVECFLPSHCTARSELDMSCIDNKCERIDIEMHPAHTPHIRVDEMPWWFDEIPHVSPPNVVSKKSIK